MTKKELIKLTEQICKGWKMDMPQVEIRSSHIMNNIAGLAFFPRKSTDDFKPIIVFNAKVLYNETFDYIINVLFHELAHIYTQKGDNDIEFINFCKHNHIWLNE